MTDDKEPVDAFMRYIYTNRKENNDTQKEALESNLTFKERIEMLNGARRLAKRPMLRWWEKLYLWVFRPWKK